MADNNHRNLQTETLKTTPLVKTGKQTSFFDLSPWGLKPLSAWLSLVIIAGVAIILNINTLGHDFVLDDMGVLSRNRFVLKGIAGIPEIMSNRTWEGFEGSVNKTSFNYDYAIYRPLSLVFFALEYQIGGLNPAFFHLMHILYFAICCIVVFFLMQELSERKLPWLSLLVALIYAIHPVHVEVVANLKSRDEMLAALFGFLGLMYMVRYVRNSNKILNLVLGLFFYTLGLFSKESALTLSAVLPLALFYFTDAPWKKIALNTAIFAVPVLAVLGIRQLVLAEDVPFYQFTYLDNPLMMADTLSRKLGLRLWTIGKALSLLTIPYELRSSYHFGDITYVEFSDWRSLLSLALHLFLGFCLIRYFLKRSYVIFGLAFYVITYSMYSNILFVMNNLIGERWFFTPSLGFCICLGVIIYRLMQKGAEIKQWGDFILANMAWLAIFISIVLAYGYKTFTRNLEWQTNFTLAAADVITCPKSVLVSKGFILTLLEEHKRRPNFITAQKVKDCIPYFEETTRMMPEQIQLNFALGRYYQEIGMYEKAEERLKMLFQAVGVPEGIMYETKLILAYIHNAIETDPKNNEIGVEVLGEHIKKLGAKANFLIYKEYGLALYWTKRYPEAAQAFQKALDTPDAKAQKPDMIGMVWAKMGASLALANDLPSSAKCYGNAVNIAPNSFEALAGYARVLNLQGYKDQADAYAKRAQAAAQQQGR